MWMEKEERVLFAISQINSPRGVRVREREREKERKESCIEGGGGRRGGRTPREREREKE